jgi:electron transport complex protein RnfC
VLKTFAKGGVHPAENKLSAKSAIEVLPLPKKVVIPIAQHIGAPAKPLVKKGDEVKVGQVIAESGGFVSANIHSSVSGKVTKVDNVIDSSGYPRMSVLIDVEGDEWLETIDRSDNLVTDISMSAEDIVKRVMESGIVGLGGATFPSHVKLSVPKGKTVEVLVLNGVECEPYLTSDDRLMLEKAEEMIVGVRILMKALNVSRAIIGIENNKPESIKNVTTVASRYTGIEVAPLKVKYPQGGEKQLLKAAIKREVPSGALPLDVGAVVHNVGTAFAVYEAVQKNKPLFERVVTVTGKKLAKPSNFMVRVGTPVNELIDAAGGLPENTGKVINGGPMMGKALNSLDVAVTKGTSGLVIMDDSEATRRTESNCIKCAKCVDVCPMGLEPHLLSKLAKKQIHDKLETERVMDCMECGSCSFECPASIALLDYIRLGKNRVGQIMRARK